MWDTWWRSNISSIRRQWHTGQYGISGMPRTRNMNNTQQWLLVPTSLAIGGSSALQYPWQIVLLKRGFVNSLHAMRGCWAYAESVYFVPYAVLGVRGGWSVMMRMISPHL
ncbi:hypothetical protein LSAT2_028404 [Lamellibrachia satsuma]|nr:hypothetical protein LSAT2_028404 [Lamellibrachia satsuma]